MLFEGVFSLPDTFGIIFLSCLIKGNYISLKELAKLVLSFNLFLVSEGYFFLCHSKISLNIFFRR
nr:MAG TPA: hypothetical protein [Caudoviricetes sp.]